MYQVNVKDAQNSTELCHLCLVLISSDPVKLPTLLSSTFPSILSKDILPEQILIARAAILMGGVCDEPLQFSGSLLLDVL